MCIRDRNAISDTIANARNTPRIGIGSRSCVAIPLPDAGSCLLYTSDAADDLLCVDLGGRRIIKKKHNTTKNKHNTHDT